MVVGAVLGGTASKLSGGKFANGAVTGAFSQALNNELTEERRVDAQKGMTTSADGVEFIKGWESFSSSPYKVLDSNGNPTGNWTVGYGHEITDAEFLSGNFNNISKAQGLKLLATDISAAEGLVNRFIANNNSSISLSQNQFDALVSLSMNSGYIGRFPSLSANFSAANHAGVATEFLDITNGGVSGLVKRRAAEYNIYMNSNYSGRP